MPYPRVKGISPPSAWSHKFCLRLLTKFHCFLPLPPISRKGLGRAGAFVRMPTARKTWSSSTRPAYSPPSDVSATRRAVDFLSASNACLCVRHWRPSPRPSSNGCGQVWSVCHLHATHVRSHGLCFVHAGNMSHRLELSSSGNGEADPRYGCMTRNP